MINLKETLKDIVGLARKVGDFQKESIHSKKQLLLKSTDIDFATNIDIESEKMIIEYINENYKGHSILAEESGESVVENDYKWVIDPLDGTTNYINGYPIYSVSIALNFKDEPVLGVIYVPELNAIYSAYKNGGAYLNGNKLSVSTTNTLTKSIITTGFSYERTGKNNNIKEFQAVMPKVRGIRRSGSCAFDLACVASGTIEGYWETVVSKWDYMAGKIIVLEAGGEFYVKDSHLKGKDSLLVTNAHVTDELGKLIDY